MQTFITKTFESFQLLQNKWDEFNSQSVEYATSLVNNSIRRQYLDVQKNWGVFQSDVVLQQLCFVKLEEQISESFNLLEDICGEFSVLLEEMKKLARSVETLHQGVGSQLGHGFVSEKPVFKTASLQKYCKYLLWFLSNEQIEPFSHSFFYNISPVEASNEIEMMYSQELAVKKAILTDIHLNKNRTTLLLYITTWQMQPSLDKDRLKDIHRSIAAENGSLEQQEQIKSPKPK